MKDHVCVSVKPMTDCERADIPFGFYESDTAETVDPLEAADGKKESLFTVQEAVVRMFDLDESTLWPDQWDGKTFFRFERAPAAAEDALMYSVYPDPDAYCYKFMGEESPNPFNCGDAKDARFSRSAFYRWWKENPNGLPCPKWFDDLRRADESKQKGVNQFPVECVSELPEEPEDVPPPDECWVIEHMCEKCYEFEPRKAPNAAPSVAPSVVPDVEEISADLSAAIDFGAATRDVLDVLADYLKRPPERRKSGNPAFPTEAQCVLDALDVKAKHKGWGTGDDGRLSQAQWIGVRLLFLPPTENKGRKGSRWGGNTDREPKK